MNTDMTAHAFLTDFLLEQIAEQPIERRLLLYRALAVDTADFALRKACTARADEIERLMLSERQMLLDFRRKHSRTPIA